MKTKTLLTLLLLLPVFLFAQLRSDGLGSSLELKGNEPFYLVANNKLACDIPQTEYSFYFDTLTTFYLINDSCTTILETTEEASSQRKKSYDVLISKKNISLLFVTEASNKDTAFYFCEASDSTINVDSLITCAFKNVAERSGGCVRPISETKFNEWYKTVEKELFDFKKMALVLEKLKSGMCVNSTQTEKLLLSFEFDDKKMELIKALKGNVFDVYNLETVEPQLVLPQNKAYWEGFVDGVMKN